MQSHIAIKMKIESFITLKYNIMLFYSQHLTHSCPQPLTATDLISQFVSFTFFQNVV